MKETIEEAAERLYPAHTYWIGDGKHKALFDPYCGERISFIEGAKWQQEQMKAREIESPIVKQLLDETTPEQFNKIDKEMSNNKQSSVEWLQEQYNQCDKYERQIHEQDWEQAKAMEKEQIEKVKYLSFLENWWNEGASYMYDGQRKYNSFEQYYNETYGGK